VSPARLTEDLVQEAPVLRTTDTVADALQALRATHLPAVPVVDERDRLAGIFGEREFLIALFPGYLGQLRSAKFVTRSLDEALEKRAVCKHETVGEHLNTDEIRVPRDYSDVQVAEIFLHHRVLMIPVVEDGRVVGVITRSDFFERLADRLMES